MHIQKCMIVILLLCIPSNSYAEGEITCLAKNIYFESRNQPWVGQVAVAQVTLNRVRDSRFPNTICKVVKQKRSRKTCQFSWYCDGLSDKPKNMKKYREIFNTAVYIYTSDLPDLTEGALWYHTTTVQPWWAKSYRRTININDHIFYARPRGS